MIDMELVKQVRNRSGAGVNDCRKALEEASGDVEQALTILQKKGVVKAISISHNVATDGRVLSYVHNFRIGVLLEVNCVTDFSAKSAEFVQFCEEVSMHIAGMNPKWIDRHEIPVDLIEKQNEIFSAQIVQELSAKNRPASGLEKILDGKFSKWYKEVCLLEQESMIHAGQTIEQLRVGLVAKIRENVQIRRFARWELGEGIAKPQVQDFADEVSKLAGG